MRHDLNKNGAQCAGAEDPLPIGRAAVGNLTDSLRRDDCANRRTLLHRQRSLDAGRDLLCQKCGAFRLEMHVLRTLKFVSFAPLVFIHVTTARRFFS